MSYPSWPKAAVLALAAIARQAYPADPTDANAPIAPSAYVSAYANYRAPSDEKATPDQVWRAANEAVREQDTAPPKADPHAGHHTMQGK